MVAPCPQVFGKPEVISPENWLLNQFRQSHGGLHLKSDECIDKRGLDSSHLDFFLVEAVMQSHCIPAIAVVICEPENIEVKLFFPLREEKVLMEEAQKLASRESEDDRETSDESSDSNMKSTCCSNSSYGENEESSDDSRED